MADTITLIGLGFIPLFLVLDLVHRARRFDAPRFWRVAGLLVSAGAFVLSIGVATLWGTLLGDFHLFDLGGLGAAGAVVGILVYQLCHYWYHRAAHAFDPLWRWAHQMHHSAESLDAFGAYFLSPLDTFFFTTWSSLVFFPLLGLSLEAGAIGAAFLTFNAMFQHANIRTPRWLGYLIQRPESHGIHHERGVHRSNYADLPLFDMIFGTFDNPRTWAAEAGFYNGASRRIGAMLLARDVTREPLANEEARQPAPPPKGRMTDGRASTTLPVGDPVYLRSTS